MTGRKPRMKETRARQVARGNELRTWLHESLSKSRAAIARQVKADLLTGGEGGGNGVTITMRRISGEAASRPVEVVNPGGLTGPNRYERRHGVNMQTRDLYRPRETRQFVAGPLLPGRWTGHTVWPTPPSQNVPYVRPRGDAGGDHA